MSQSSVDTLIKQDHDKLRSLYQDIKNETNVVEKQKFTNEFIKTLSVHSVAEEMIVYPAFEARLVKGRDTADHSREEHGEIKHELYKLDQMTADQKGFDQQLDRVFEILDKHSKEEEEELLPALARTMYESELTDIGEQFQATKTKVPTHPHPWAPDRPPFETIAGMLQAPLDKLYDWIARDYPTATR
ncbi:hypothetical protein MIR68_005999 [Amoeboaphelidium protococcarum]|nr:hypothetical protein MIR68_005999 [Amoeboaphelidium protococcarum]